MGITFQGYLIGRWYNGSHHRRGLELKQVEAPCPQVLRCA